MLAVISNFQDVTNSCLHVQKHTESKDILRNWHGHRWADNCHSNALISHKCFTHHKRLSQKLTNTALASLSSEVAEKKKTEKWEKRFQRSKVRRHRWSWYVSNLSLDVCGCCHRSGRCPPKIVEVLHVLLNSVHRIVQFVHASLKVLRRTLHGRTHEALEKLAHQVPAA